MIHVLFFTKLTLISNLKKEDYMTDDQLWHPRFLKLTPLHQNLGKFQYSQNIHLQNQSLICHLAQEESRHHDKHL